MDQSQTLLIIFVLFIPQFKYKLMYALDLYPVLQDGT